MLVGQHPSGADRELGEQPEFHREQMHQPIGKGRPALGVVNGQLAQHVRLRWFGDLPTAQGRPDPRRELRRREGLYDVIGGAHAEGRGDELVPAVGGKEDDRHVRRVQHLLHQLDAVSTREHEVQQHQLGPLFCQEAERLLRIPCHCGSVTRPDEGVLDIAKVRGIVVHRQHPHPFTLPAPRGTRRGR